MSPRLYARPSQPGKNLGRRALQRDPMPKSVLAYFYGRPLTSALGYLFIFFFSVSIHLPRRQFSFSPPTPTSAAPPLLPPLSGIIINDRSYEEEEEKEERRRRHRHPTTSIRASPRPQKIIIRIRKRSCY